jgi:phosphate starvation-inducible PhoH-like protein
MIKKKSKKLTSDEESEIISNMTRDRSVNFIKSLHIDIKCKTSNQKKFINLIKEKEIVIANGLAGTGKTFLSCAEALKLLKADPKYKKIVIVKSVTTHEEIGFLKGTMEDKMAPFMYSFMSNFNKIIGKALTDQLTEMGMIEVLPIAYIRGMSIDNSIIIVDEAQNISLDNIRTILTRIGENSKLIFIGDSRQNDQKNKNDSGLSFLVDHFKHIQEIGICEFDKNDVVRNPLIIKIEETFDDLEDRNIYKRK